MWLLVRIWVHVPLAPFLVIVEALLQEYVTARDSILAPHPPGHSTLAVKRQTAKVSVIFAFRGLPVSSVLEMGRSLSCQRLHMLCHVMHR